MRNSKINDVIYAAIALSSNQLKAADRSKLGATINVARNTTYLLQRQGKLPPPIAPPMGSKFWYRYEVDALLISMADPEIYPEEMVAALVEARNNLPALIMASATTKQN
jgi:hypothetical protein